VYRNRIVLPAVETAAESPVFLVGLHRSGSTLMRQIIDSHSGIACPPETFFLLGMEEIIRNEQYAGGLDAMGFNREGALQGLRLSASFFYETYAALKGKPRWADKTPQYVWILNFVEELFGPSCQYVMIYRHPFDVADSLFRKRWSLVEYADDPFLNVLTYVANGLRKQRRFQERYFERCLECRYEELVTEPERVVKGILSFLGEEWESSVLRFNDFDHDWGTGDPEALHLKGFRPSIGNYRNWSLDQLRLAEKELGALVRELGYTVEAREALA
jgi:protein-tyrosine sulfotransferase